MRGEALTHRGSARGHGAGHGRRGDPGAAGRLAARSALRGEKVDELTGFALAMRERVLADHAPGRRDRHVRHGRRWLEDVQHLDGRSARCGRSRCARCQARQSRDVVGDRFGRRAGGAGIPIDLHARRRVGGARARRLCVPLRTQLPPGDEACGTCPPGARRAHGIQPARPNDQSGRRPPPGDRGRRPDRRGQGRSRRSTTWAPSAPSSSTATGSTSCRSMAVAWPTTFRRAECGEAAHRRSVTWSSLAASSELRGGDAAENAAIIEGVLIGEHGAAP